MSTNYLLVVAPCAHCGQLGPVLLTQLPIHELWTIPPRYWCSYQCHAADEAAAGLSRERRSA
jgi:hypothetical protein